MTTATFQTERPTEVTADKLRFAVGQLAVQVGKPTEKLVAVSMLARSNEPIDHYYWGRCVHDFAGMMHNDRIVIDFEHGVVVGYADIFAIEAEGLNLGGFIIRKPNQPDHPANDLIENAAAGVPYEASIYFDPFKDLVVESVPEGVAVPVNGGTFEGPGVVFREFKLKAVAITAHGYDDNTRTNFELSEKSTSVRITTKEGTMTKKPAGNTGKLSATAEAEAPATTGQETKPGEAEATSETETKTEGGATAEGQESTSEPTREETLLKRIEALEGQLSTASQAETVDPLEARIAALEGKLSKAATPGKANAAAAAPAPADAIGELTAKVDQAIAKLNHLAGSGSEAAGAGEAGAPKPTLASMIKRTR